MSIPGKGKTSVSISGVEAYSKEAFATRINEFIVINA